MKIDPENLDLRSLPSIPLEDRKMLPVISGIYFAIDSQGTVQYIGRSANLNQRWLQHHRISNLEECDRILIAWLEVTEPALLPEIEKALIDWFKPPLNGYISLSQDRESDGLVRTSVTIPESVMKKFRDYCNKQRRSVSAQLTLLIEKELEDQDNED